jgi:hypothetical protein
LFPCENLKDYNNFIDKYKNNILVEGIKFHAVNKIHEVFEFVFEN